MTISEFIEKVTSVYGFSTTVRYAHPTLYIICTAKKFEGISPENRLDSFCTATAVSLADVELVLASPMIELVLATPDERARDYAYLDAISASSSWLSAFSPSDPNARGQTGAESELNSGGMQNETLAKAVHFYGYKGGQGRSTVLLAMAKTLAHAGYRVLAVDADIEAPSLDAMLKVAATGIEATLMGLAIPGTRLSPLSPAYVSSSSSGGSVDLIAARPASARYDMDFAAFLLNASLDPTVLKKAVSDIRRQVAGGQLGEARRYDVVLFDHRTGLSPSVLPIMEAWPGPAVIFVRPDGMAQHIVDSRLIDTLLSHDAESPGAFVSFSLDPKKSAKDVRELDPRYMDGLLAKIGNAMHLGEVDPEDLDLDPYWIFWRHDQTLVDGKQPVPNDMSSENRDAISQLRSILGLSGGMQNDSYPALTSSGSSDEGQFILTPNLAKLFTRESPYNYIFGRKGTGKTRLLSELVHRGFAEPLLVASDSRVGGLQSAGVTFQYALTACNRDFQQFWWLLLGTALKMESTKDSAIFEAAIKSQIAEIATSSGGAVIPSDLAKGLGIGVVRQRRVFVIDGVETAVPAADLRPFIESLFRFLNTIQNDHTLSQLVTIRLFLRTDMATGAAENVEQQIEGSVIYLHWNKTAILNFALARIVSLRWFTSTFPAVCKKIRDQLDKISRSALQDEEAESMLLEMFPAGLERNRLKTTTFLSAYFSDAGGESGGDAAFYPRLFDGFLRTLAHNCEEAAGQNLIEGKISSAAVLHAYDQASRAFIGDVRAELYSLLNLDPDTGKNRDAVDRLIAAFDGMQTPFVVEDTIDQLVNKVDGLPKEVIRQSISSMQRIGMFESRPKAPGELRARQLYKAGLGMKYVRGGTRAGRSASQTVGDETLIRELEADLPLNIVLALANHDFLKPLEYSVVESLTDFLERWGSPERGFSTKGRQLGIRRVGLAVGALMNELAERTVFKISDPSMIWVVPEHVRDKPNKQDRLDAQELMQRSKELANAYQDFLKEMP